MTVSPGVRLFVLALILACLGGCDQSAKRAEAEAAWKRNRDIREGRKVVRVCTGKRPTYVFRDRAGVLWVGQYDDGAYVVQVDPSITEPSEVC